ncbi:YybH family protein [Devosia sp. CAU 1758]
MRPFLMAAAMAAAMIPALTHAQETTSMSDETAILETIKTMTDAFALGDIDTIMSTYADPASVVAAPGQTVSGDGSLRAMFADFVASGVKFTYGAHEVVVSGDAALHLMAWEAPGPDNQLMRALSVAVLLRQPDGTWKMVIDHPFGDTVMATK